MGKLYKKKEKDEITDLTWKTAMSSRNGLSEMRTISDAGTRYLIFKVRWSKIIMELVDTTNSTGTNFWQDMQIICRLNLAERKENNGSYPARGTSDFTDDIGENDVVIRCFID